jgi:hypothetical protein
MMMMMDLRPFSIGGTTWCTVHHTLIRHTRMHQYTIHHSPGNFEGKKVLELRFDDAPRSVTSATLFTTNTNSFGTNPKIYGSNDGTTWNELLDTQTSCNGGLSVKYLAGSPYPNNIYGGYQYAPACSGNFDDDGIESCAAESCSDFSIMHKNAQKVGCRQLAWTTASYDASVRSLMPAHVSLHRPPLRPLMPLLP